MVEDDSKLTEASVEAKQEDPVPEVVEETVERKFPMDAKVILHGLTKAPEFNGKQGIVKSALNAEGRQEVLVGKKILGLKPTNLKYEIRPLATLSLQELKRILKEKDDSINFAGMDVSDLRREVIALGEEEKAFELLAYANEKAAIERAKEAEKEAKASKMKLRANQLTDMSPEQIRSQAQMMKTMPPDQLRRMNPQLRNMSDAQIRQAADQMLMMSENPEMLKRAADQVQNMSPEELQRVAEQEQKPKTIADMTPEQLLSQAQMMRSMSKDQLRKMNPQFAHFSDSQIEQSIQQMEQMAMNPEMLEMMKSQMKDMSPSDLERLRQGMEPNGATGSASGQPTGSASGSGTPPIDPSNMLENMTGKQLKELMKLMKEKPDMVQSMLPPGTSLEAMKKSLAMFDGMSDEQLDTTLETMKKFQKYLDPFRKTYSKVNSLCGGQLLTVAFVLGVIFFTYGILFVAMKMQSPSAAPDLASATASFEQTWDEQDSEF